jgi:hypothetical protein
MRIAATEPGRLPMRGMKPREWAGLMGFESLSGAVRNQMIKTCKDRLLALRKAKQPAKRREQ